MKDKTMPNSTIIRPTQDLTPSLNDSIPTINAKLAQQEQRAIIEDFQLDFGFSIDELPSLDLPIESYEKHLVWLAEDEQETKEIAQEEQQAIILEMHEDCSNWDCETDAYNRVLPEDRHAVAGLVI